ncbi:helix-turn-helix domain-containing protein [Micromonospora saelicesensis]|uniref:helix-turn-helix domain-containing protein n=1 Tax=Micromonospora saelicesensis TaxID=285676 RepID=UPI003D93C8C5
MNTDRRWCNLPEAQQATANGDYGALLRVARTAARLTLAEAGERCGYSAATLSRLERGRQPLTDVTVLRRLAEVFDIPPQLFGLTVPNSDASYRSAIIPEGARRSEALPELADGAIRRRDLLGGLASVVGTTLSGAERPVATPPLRIVTSLEDILLADQPAGSRPVDRAQLRSALSAAWSDFHACRYARLSARLPRLVAAASSSHATADTNSRAATAAVLTRTYHLTTQLLIKLHEDGMAWSAMDRATQAARDAEDPLLHAETARISAIVLRRTRHQQRAQQTAINAARALDSRTGLISAAEVNAYGRLLATAAYTAAAADRRDAAWELLNEAADAARRGRSGETFTDVDIALYRISTARTLGDFGAAVEYARALRPQQLNSVERRARYWQDCAMALFGRGALAESYQALLAAEQTAPQEVRYRPWTLQLTTSLLSADRRQTLPGLRSFAARNGVAS